jgi:hypothetical protein
VTWYSEVNAGCVPDAKREAAEQMVRKAVDALDLPWSERYTIRWFKRETPAETEYAERRRASKGALEWHRFWSTTPPGTVLQGCVLADAWWWRSADREVWLATALTVDELRHTAAHEAAHLWQLHETPNVGRLYVRHRDMVDGWADAVADVLTGRTSATRVAAVRTGASAGVAIKAAPRLDDAVLDHARRQVEALAEAIGRATDRWLRRQLEAAHGYWQALSERGAVQQAGRSVGLIPVRSRQYTASDGSLVVTRNVPGVHVAVETELGSQTKAVAAGPPSGRAEAGEAWTAARLLETKDGTIRLGGYALVWGGKDLVGEHFTPATVWSGITRTPPLLYGHGQDPEIGKAAIGKVDRLRPDDVGLWAEATLDRAGRRVGQIRSLLEGGWLGMSTGSVPHLVDITQQGEIRSWPIVEVSLTTEPAEPRTVGVREL